MKENLIRTIAVPTVASSRHRSGRLVFTDNRPSKTREDRMIAAIQRSTCGIIQRTKFIVGGTQYDSQRLSIADAETLIPQLAAEQTQDPTSWHEENLSAILALKKFLGAQKDTRAQKLLQWLRNIQQGDPTYPFEPEPRPAFSSEAPPSFTTPTPESEPTTALPPEEQETILAGHPFHALTRQIGVLASPDIQYHLDQRKKFPENVRSEIAEYLTGDEMRKTLSPTIPQEVLTGIRVVLDTPGAEYPIRVISEIDNLLVNIVDGLFIPVEVVETKAGREGSRAGKLRTQLSPKIKALKEVEGQRYRIIDKNDTDLTSKFDMKALSGLDIHQVATSGTEGYHKYPIMWENIDGVLDYLIRMHQLRFPEVYSS